MMRTLWTAASGMIAMQTNIDNISNNLANVNTTGFKRTRAEFQDLLYQTLRPTVTTPLQVGLGVRPVATSRVFTNGTFEQTGKDTDLAIDGEGFFQVVNANGESFLTRDGSFKLDASGKIVNSDGYALQPEMTVPPDGGVRQISIGKDGVINILLAGQADPQQLGQIQLSRVPNPDGLEAVGGNLYRTTPQSGSLTQGNPGTPGFGSIQQSSLEASNVQVVEEMVAMITAQRAYEINSKAIQAADEMLGQADNLRR